MHKSYKVLQLSSSSVNLSKFYIYYILKPQISISQLNHPYRHNSPSIWIQFPQHYLHYCAFPFHSLYLSPFFYSVSVFLPLYSAAVLVTDQDFWALLSIEIAKSPDKKFRQGFIGTHAATSNRIPCSLPGLRGKFVPYME